MLTFQDFEAETDKLAFIKKAINEYTSGEIYRTAVEAEEYFKGENRAILKRKTFKITLSGKEIDLGAIKIPTNFFKRFVIQQNSTLLTNGVILQNNDEKKKLGFGFDKILSSIGKKALIHGVSWGFWDYNKLMQFTATEFFPLLDERKGIPMAGIRFWQLEKGKPTYIEFYEMDGVTEYTLQEGEITLNKDKRPYIQTVRRDIIATEVTETENYNTFPIVPLYANEYKQSELTESIKAKIDLYDIILSDFGSTMERIKGIIWVFENFSGTSEQLMDIRKEIEELGILAVQEEGGKARPHTIDIPHAAVEMALDMLERALYADYMAMDMSQITGASLTNVAIQTAQDNLTKKVDDFEWQVFKFMQQILLLVGIETENIKLKRSSIVNEIEVMQMIYMCREDLTHRKALELNPLIEQDEVETILTEFALEGTGIPDDESDDDDQNNNEEDVA